MRIVVREDIAAPPAQVFAAAADFDGFERQALRRGAEVRREGGPSTPGPGAAWRVRFGWRGREREALVTLARLEPPSALGALVEGGGLHGTLAVDLLALSRTTTRLTLTLDLEGRTLAARVLVGTLRLGRARMEARAGLRLKAWARDLEARWARRAGGEGGRGQGRA